MELRGTADRYDPHQGGRDEAMMWIKPVLEEICIGLEINGYLPAEF